ncbi:MAG: HlyC/CorC family transporter [Pseudomonadales bacterium]|nr:HlyC/CorC family transporter [Pseudomonadales bacterium]MBO6565927.1 HlyC/CorC family transporter [Pseudomonadales bacterium]MBO6596331.1 HlyC/CorC family transporter [Pseudomonadales bacterium]MBO6658969.1 HlyC/CorC family transporter [Pseudomonadales bacterium]MBO6702942.1 HlyC/CorC family transporter [Pseudomonadales bacterium]
MDDPSTGALLGSIILLVIVSAYFSGSETAMMALNRYRIKHLSKEGHGGARRAEKLLERPDRLLGVILIGNNLANFTAASLATVLALNLLGEAGVAAAPVICTIVFLVFAEVAPKTIAAVYPEKIALPSSYLLKILLWISYPFVWLVNGIANNLLKLFGVRHEEAGEDHLSLEELRTVVHEGSQVAGKHQDMMLGVLDLGKVTVDDIMVPRTEIMGIDIEDDMDEIVAQIRSVQHTRLPVFKEDIDRIIGMLHVRNAARFLIDGNYTKAALLQETTEPYFVPESTPLETQLINFQGEKERIAMVVDEYGDIQGIVTLEDILEEIVGDFTTDLAATSVDIHPQEDGSYLVDGGAQIRLLNRTLGWELPIDGPKTLNGLITEHLETIPDANICFTIENYRFEIVQIHDNMIRTAKLSEPPEPF